MEVHTTFPVPCDFFDIYPPNCHRWQDLNIHIQSKSLLNLIRQPSAWVNLTKFTLSSDSSLVNCVAILTLCPNLKICNFLRVFESSNPTPQSELIQLLHLESLKLYGREDLYIVLDRLKAPKLRDLAITFYWPQPWQMTRMLAPLEQSEYPLRKLVIEGLDIPERDLIHCVRKMPELVEFKAVLRGVNLVTQRVLDIMDLRKGQRPSITLT
jgi:hypothetical protein